MLISAGLVGTICQFRLQGEQVVSYLELKGSSRLFASFATRRFVICLPQIIPGDDVRKCDVV